MFVYILLTYLFLIFILAIWSTVESTSGIFLLGLFAVAIPWLLVRLAKLARQPR